MNLRTGLLIGCSPQMRALDDDLRDAARSDAKVLITGESGVGKELAARTIHSFSSRSSAPLVTLNSAGVPDSLLESELFGHLRGSFTGAYRDKPGIFELARRGTVLLDEVGEMSLRMQSLLLRFLETGEIQRVGSDRPLPPLDVRVIAATHRNLQQHVGEKTFREDLYYRLNVIQIEVPPLRDRCGDIPALLSYFLRAFSDAHRMPAPDVSPEAMQRLISYEWPGNVRELKNVAERLVVGARSGRIDVGLLPTEVAARPAPAAVARPANASASVNSSNAVQQRLDRLMKERVSFWSEVHRPFMDRDLTRDEVRELVRVGLEHTRGNYKMLVSAFNMPPEDYKRFLSFLRAYQCHVSFRPFRMIDGGRREHAEMRCA
jgi:DNA-binding NtrC family response regulator